MIVFDNNIFGKRLKIAMKVKGIKNKELAKAVCLTDCTISFYRTGRKLPNLDNAFYIAGALGVSLDWLCGKGEDNEV